MKIVPFLIDEARAAARLYFLPLIALARVLVGLFAGTQVIEISTRPQKRQRVRA